MIDRQEIMEFSRELSLTPNVIEKDYVLGWLLAGIHNSDEIGTAWVFKGGTCLKKCYFETYRFSEDLDFTIRNPDHLNEDYLVSSFRDIAEWVYDTSGIEIPGDAIRFDVYTNPRGAVSVQGRIGYRGPLQPGGDLPRVKLDLTNDEVLVLDPVVREVHHPYTDRPEDGIQIRCYSFDEVFAEKIRALTERLRPRDLYDVVHLYRHDDVDADRARVMSTLESKCRFKGILVPTMEILSAKPERSELEEEWENMLAHQLPMLPPFEQFWNDLPQVFDWLHTTIEKVESEPMPARGEAFDETWQMPAMAQAWHAAAPLETIRFAAANRLCVDLKYLGKNRLIEPYSLRKTKDGNLLLYAVKHETGEDRSYRIDRIQGASATKITFKPRYAIELTATGTLSVPPTSRRSDTSGLPTHRRARSSSASTRKSTSSTRRSNYSSGSGLRYVIECSYCSKRFYRKKNTTRLNPHKDKTGYPCPGKTGYWIDTRY